MNATASYWIDRLSLIRHPEGGWFCETYRSAGSVAACALPVRFGGERSLSTAIYFLLEAGEFSAFHRIKSDEMWHAYTGDALTVHVIDPDGEYRALRLGGVPERGECFQGVVPAGCWFAAETEGEYSLVGCTVSPGFAFEDFEMAARGALVSLYPRHRELITRFTR
ncbi:MAG: cupin domain-containing protein [Deltaproteobacteria bacterium]|nr:cupin domain-containing protein [Deltaproteobacteria bacterium]